MSRYYIIDHAGQTAGPFTLEVLVHQARLGSVNAATRVRREDAEDWTTADAIPELGEAINAPKPPPRPGTANPGFTPFQPSASHATMPQADWVVPVLVTCFCCVAGGIIALIYTAQANTAAAAGRQVDYDQAMKTRETWVKISIIVGIAIPAIWFAFVFLTMVAGCSIPLWFANP